jgi:UDP-2,3-diacylglucosamine hydrolase
MQKVLFISDFHLGAPNDDLSKEREKKVCDFLDQQIHKTDILFLVGDILIQYSCFHITYC